MSLARQFVVTAPCPRSPVLCIVLRKVCLPANPRPSESLCKASLFRHWQWPNRQVESRTLTPLSPSKQSLTGCGCYKPGYIYRLINNPMKLA